jgi:putative zinc finger/helix-turn-helix YgiT family protein
MKERDLNPPKSRLGAWKAPKTCLGCERPDTLSVKSLPSVQQIQGEEIRVETEKWHCSACGAEWMSPDQATTVVAKAVSAFQKKHRLLTATEVRALREAVGWTQDELAHNSTVSIATIKRLESGVHVIGRLQDEALRRALGNAATGSGSAPKYEFEFETHSHAGIPACTSAAGSYEAGQSTYLDPYAEALSGAADSNELALAA